MKEKTYKNVKKNGVHIGKRIVTGLMALTLLVSLIPGRGVVAADKVTQEDLEVDATSWMSAVSGEVKLSSISIPGTHDSAAQYAFPGYFMECQDTSIEEQLENGYRYFDLRVALAQDGKEEKPYLKLVHNFADCREESSLFSDAIKLADVIDTMYAFLENHPTETVIFTVKAEDEDDDVASIQNLLYEAIDENPNQWYTVNEIPTLDEVRGKIVLASRLEDAIGVSDTRSGLNFQWEDQGDKEIVDVPYVNSMINDSEQLWVQDRYNYNTESKWEAVVDDMENCQANDDTFSINFTSTSGSGWLSHPKGYAKYINSQLLDYDMIQGVCYGIIAVDNGTQEIAEHIYETNFQ